MAHVDTFFRHPFHLVDYSPWPLIGANSALTLVLGLVGVMQSIIAGFITLLYGIATIIYTMFFWWRDVIREATFFGWHTFRVQISLRYGMILFIVSEVMFFVSLFWTFFCASLSPTVQLGIKWPPHGIYPMNPFTIPLANTFLLITSGYTLTWAHHALVAGKRWDVLTAFLLTLCFAVVFTGFQLMEYTEAGFDISDSIYGSIFYLLTGFHGFHVLIGTIFLTVCVCRHYEYHFTKEHHIGFESAAWYWHFVDVVWIIVFMFIYIWGSWSAL